VRAASPLLFTGKPFLRTKASFIRLHFPQILVSGLCFLVPIIPQLAYWKWLTGHTIYDSYGPNQGFDFLHPHIWAGIFSASNGWLFYTPLMLFALIGFCFAERWRVVLAGAALLLLTYTLAVYSWFLPNYINGLGSRPMIDIYPVLALPLAAFLNRLQLANRVLKYTGAAIITLFVFVNISYSAKKALGLLDTEHSNYAFNIATFFRYGLTYNDLVLWDINVLQPHPQKLLVTDRFCTSVKDSAYSSHVIFDTVERSRVYFVQEGEEYAPLRIKISAQELMRGKARWIHCSGRFRTSYPESDIFKNHLLVLRIFRGDKNLHWFGCRINNKVGLKENAALRPDLFTFRTKLWGEVDYYVPVPDDLEANDQVQLDIWNIGKRPLYISNLCLSICK
jgi:hypothetical protein